MWLDILRKESSYLGWCIDVASNQDIMPSFLLLWWGSSYLTLYLAVMLVMTSRSWLLHQQKSWIIDPWHVLYYVRYLKKLDCINAWWSDVEGGDWESVDGDLLACCSSSLWSCSSSTSCQVSEADSNVMSERDASISLSSVYKKQKLLLVKKKRSS